MRDHVEGAVLGPKAMPAILFVLSCPVRLQDGAFGVITGTETSVWIRRFRSRWWAKCHHALLVSTMRAVVDAPVDLVLIDGVADLPAMQSRIRLEYERRGLTAAWQSIGPVGAEDSARSIVEASLSKPIRT